MKKLSALGLLVLAFLSAIPAVFAEEGQKDPWTGPYIGLTVGMGEGEVQETPDFERNQAQLDGSIFGVLVGYDYRIGDSKIISGIAGSIGKGNISGSRTEDLCPGCVVSNIDTTETRIEWLNTLYVRLGYDMGDFLPYLLGGIVIGEAETSVRNVRRLGGSVDTAGSWTKQAFVGGMLGFGLDYRITEKITIGARFARVEFDLLETANNSSFRGIGLSGNIAQAEIKLSF